MNARMYEIAERYGVIGLKDLAKYKFGVSCDLFWDNDTFTSTIDYVYSSTIDTDQGLRSVIRKTICKHIQIIKKDEIAAKLDELGLAMAILEEKMEEQGWADV